MKFLFHSTQYIFNCNNIFSPSFKEGESKLKRHIFILKQMKQNLEYEHPTCVILLEKDTIYNEICRPLFMPL